MAFSEIMHNTIRTLFTGILLLPVLNSAAQIDYEQPAPIDPDIRTGRLDNGLTYFIRHNKEPEKRASFYIIQNAGAILENDDQDGLAHFLEHMAFNGTQHFPGKTLISSLEKHGVAFGYNINAYTGFDETVYNISDVPVDKPGLVDTCLLILHDWSDFITLSGEEIDLERGVIAEEWRTSKNAARRMLFEIIPVVLKGSKYAQRDIIGELDIIRNFDHDNLRRFYHDWYRTDLQAIAVVGDINVDEIEASVIEIFSKIPPVSNPLPRIIEEVPWHKETFFVLAKDREASQTSVSVVSLHNATPPEKKNLGYIREQHLITLMNSMLNARIAELLQKSNPPFISGSISFGSYYSRANDAFSISAVARKNEEAEALRSIYAEAERARQSGFTKAELERAKASWLASVENMFLQKDKIDNDTYISGIQNYFLTGEPLTSIDFDYGFLKQVIDGITPADVSAKLREVMTDENRTIIIQGLDGDDIIHLTEQEALEIINSIKNSELEPYPDETTEGSLIEEDLPGSEIIKSRYLTGLDAVEWTLSNNVKVVFRKADYEKDNVMLTAFSFGGISRVRDDQVLAASILPQVISMYGCGSYDNITLQKMLAGKKASVSVSLAETTESVIGSSTPKDFETMMQLLYLRLAKPRFDSMAHNAIIARFEALLANMEKDPNKLKRDSISLIATGYHPRTRLLTKESVSGVSVDDIRTIYRDRFSNADEFVFFIVGNVEKETVMPMVVKYIGSLPISGRKETWINRKIEQPQGKIIREIEVPLAVPKSTVYLSFEKDLNYNPRNYLGLAVVEGILDLVYTEKVREDEGGTYGVGVMLSARERPARKAEGVITFDCDPARAEELKAIIYNEINDLIKDGPGNENLSKTVNNILKNREESKLHNAYWMNALTRYYSNGINIDDPDNYENILKSFKVKNIRKISRRMFRKADIVDLVFTPAE